MPFPIRVADVMSSPVETIELDETVATAAAECFENDIGSLVVLDDDVVAGIVTGMDLIEVLGSVDNPGEQPIQTVMSTPVVTTSPEATVGAAVRKMKEHDIARLAVLVGDDLVGLVSTDDIVRYVPQVFHRYELPSEHEATDEPIDEATDEPIDQTQSMTAYEQAGWKFECHSRSDEETTVGDRVTFTKTISEQDVRTFAGASGDTNRLHLDEEYARQTRFGTRIVHGTLVSGLISAALARLPGLTIYISQDLSFLAPVDIGDQVTAVCEVVGTFGQNKYELTTDVFDEDGEKVIEGEAAVLIDDSPELTQVERSAVV